MKSIIAKRVSQIVQTNKVTFGKFLLVGALATIVNYGVFFLLFSADVNYILAATIGYCSGIVVGFVKNRTFTFNSSNKRMYRKFISYILVYLVSLILGLGVLWICVNLFELVPTIGNLCSLVLTTITNYLGSKYFVFGQE